MIKLTKSQVISLHSQIIEATGGSDGIRDDGLLDSSLNSPFHTNLLSESVQKIKQKLAYMGFAPIFCLHFD